MLFFPSLYSFLDAEEWSLYKFDKDEAAEAIAKIDTGARLPFIMQPQEPKTREQPKEINTSVTEHAHDFKHDVERKLVVSDDTTVKPSKQPNSLGQPGGEKVAVIFPEKLQISKERKHDEAETTRPAIAEHGGTSLEATKIATAKKILAPRLTELENLHGMQRAADRAKVRVQESTRSNRRFRA